MAKNWKKATALLLALCMAMSMTAFAEDTAHPTQVVEEGGKIYYLANGEEASAENFDVWTSKTIEEIGEENKFEITLQVGSTKKAETEDVAVVLVMDVSSSMLKDKDGKWSVNKTDWKEYMPVEGPLMIDYAREAAQEFVTGLVESAGDASIKMAMVEFSNNAKTVFDWMEANDGGEVDADIIESIEKLDVGFPIDEIETEYSNWDLKVTKASFWAPKRDASGRCYYKNADGSYCEETDPFHTHDARGADLCYWVQRQASFWDAASGKCLYEGCEDTNASHKHTVEGCTYRYENEPCTDTTPFHYHKFNLSDCDAANSTFGWNTNGTMYAQRYLLTDDNGVNHLCVDYEILRQKSGGTNMEGGLLLANNLLDEGLAEGGAIEGYKNVYVVMLSDGEPTWHVTADADRTSTTFVAGQRGSSSKAEWVDIKNIVSDGTDGDLAYAEDVKEKAALYTVMYGYVGDKVIPEAAYSNGEVPAGTTVKSWLTDTDTNMVGIDELYMAEDIEGGLLEAFGNIGERIELLNKAWTVTDKLSDEVIFGGFTLNGEYAFYDEADHAITWNVGDMEPEKADAAGTCADPYVYTLKYRVQLDPEFEGVFEASASGEGVNTNKSADLYYIIAEEGEDLKKLPFDELKERMKEATFDHPAVKAFYADYGFIKLSAATKEALAGAGFTLYRDGNVWAGETFSDDNGQVAFEELSAGTYELVETTVPEGMQEMKALEFVVSYGELSANGEAMPQVIYNEPVGNDPPTITFESGDASNISFMLIGEEGVEFLYKIDIGDETSFEIPTEEGKISAVFVKQSTSGMFWFSEEVDQQTAEAVIECLKANNPSYKGYNAMAYGAGDHELEFKKGKFVTYTFTGCDEGGELTFGNDAAEEIVVESNKNNKKNKKNK